MTHFDTSIQDSQRVQALVITNSPNNLRSAILRQGQLDTDWCKTVICPGIPRPGSRADFEREIQKENLPIPPDYVYEALSLTELACFYAHLRALSIAAKSSSHTLILEDDAECDPQELYRHLHAIHQLPKDVIVKLEGTGKIGRRFVFGPKVEEANFMLSMRPSNGSAGYIVTPQSASRLLQVGLGYAHPYDMLLNDPGLHRCFLVDAVPFPIKQTGETDSTIQRSVKKRGFWNRIQRSRDKFARRISRYVAQIGRAVNAKYYRIRFVRFNNG